ncbi:MAG: hypothetical protein EBS07_10200, partial [Sphingobacteriia bacterium]|nr:hypothetical protein [Sphingobacteriia bacterium]
DKYYGGSYDGADFGTVQQSTITVVSPNTGSEVWYEGNPVSITWTNNNVNLVNIEISSNNGSTWSTIDTSISAGLGQYTWIVSGNYSQGQALIRVSDRDFPIVTLDTSNAPFTIPQYVQDKNRGGQEDGYSQGVNANNNIVVISPNGGEYWAEGSTQNIQWAANNVSNVRIEYSTNNGSVWQLISASEFANLGSYTWVVPSTPTGQGRIRILDVVNQGTVFDRSDAVFVIGTTNANKYQGGSYDGHSVGINATASITVTNPNTGFEVWYEGDQVPIQWNSVNVALVNIEISSNNGSTWTTIDTSVTAGAGQYTWISSGNYNQWYTFIRITDRSNALISDTSNLGFSIPFYAANKNFGGNGDGYSLDLNTANNILTVSPNGGETWAEGSTQVIQWSVNSINNVRLEYTTNNGSNWILISASEIGNVGFYNWLVPSTPTGQARVRVVDVLNPGTVRDASDAVFVIGSPIADKYFGGSYDGHSVNISQPPSITVVSPNTGAEVWYEGGLVTIQWTSINVNLVNLEVSSNNGSSWTTIDTSIFASLGQYTWQVNNQYSQGQALIRISDSNNPLITRDTNNVGFTIPFYSQVKNTGGDQDGWAMSINTANNLQLISPNGGENFANGSVQFIQWVSNSINNVRLEYSTNSGSSWTLISASEPATLGSYTWTVPSTATNQALVRISDVLNLNTIRDTSANLFIISSPIADKYYGGSYDGHSLNISQPPSITVVSPNIGTEVWYEGSLVNIQWSSVNVTQVNIEISSNNGSSWSLIDTAIIASLGQYTWQSTGQYSQGQALIRISDYYNPSITRDTSNVGFTIPFYSQIKNLGGDQDGWAQAINSANSLQLLSPDGGERWAEGSTQFIQWASNGLSAVRLEYTTNNGSNWIQISPTEQATLGQYSWTVPFTFTNLAKVRVSDVANPGTVFDTSTTVFTIGTSIADKNYGGSFDGHAMNISQSPSITVVSPNTGSEVWYEGGLVNILWNSVNVTSVNLEISSNNGSSWSTIDTAIVASLGQYTWQVAGQYSQGQALVRISDNANPLITRDTNNIAFTIPLYVQTKNYGGGQDGWAQATNASNQLQLISPDGGEYWAESSTQIIQWAVNGIAQVRLDYSTNNGSSWILISASEPGNTGFYSWLVPNTPTGFAKVKVSDVLNLSTVFDTSITVWTLGTSLADKYYGGSYDGYASNLNQSPSVTVLSPSLGTEVWYEGGLNTITWTSTNLSFVNIEISNDNGSNWTTIDTSITASLGSYTWQVSGQPGQNTVRVRVSDRNNPLVNDVSDFGFTIPFYAQSKNFGGTGDGFSMDRNINNGIIVVSPNGGEQYIEGTTATVAWASNLIDNVRIDYSTNNGSSWSLVASNVPANSGSYSWLIPGTLTTAGRVRISDMLNQNTVLDVSDQVFFIHVPIVDKNYGGSYDGHSMQFNQPPSITVTSPVGTDIWYVGQTVNTVWSSNNVNLVDISISTDNGSNWSTVGAGVSAGLNQFSWLLGSIAGNNSIRVRVADSNNPLVFGLSSAPHTIPYQDTLKYSGGVYDGHSFNINNATAITVLYPNGGELIAEGSTQAITWNSNAIDFVNVEYSSNNGSSWVAVATGVSGYAGSVNWTPTGVSTTGLIRITDQANPNTRLDLSNAIFQVVGPIADKNYGGSYDGNSVNQSNGGALTVVSPNGGEVLYPGDLRSITWSQQNVTLINIEFSGNNGSTWSTLVSNFPTSQNSYTWLVPDSGSIAGLIRITDSSNPLLQDVSNAIFTIPPYVASKNFGGSFDGNSVGKYPSGTLTVVNPNGGQSLFPGASYAITWNSTNVLDVAIQYSTDNGSSWLGVIASTPGPPGIFTWTIPSTPTTQALVRINDNNDPIIADISDLVFTIQQQVADKYFGGPKDGGVVSTNQSPALALTAPNGGEQWAQNSVQSITWTSTNINDLRLDYSTDNGSSWLLIDSLVPAPAGVYAWRIPTTPTTQALVMVRNAAFLTQADTSNSIFTIGFETASKYQGGSGRGDEMDFNANRNLVLVYPQAGNNLTPNTQINIQWTANTVQTVSLDFSSDNGSSWLSITSGVAANLEQWQWTVPAVNTTLGLIRVRDVQNLTLYGDTTDAPFTIALPIAGKYFGGSYDGNAVSQNQSSSLVLTTPNGNEIWYPGSQQNITWTSVNVANVFLEYSTNTGSSWITISPSEAAGAGQYAWTIPATASQQAWVRISDAQNLTLADTSNLTFVIPQEVQTKFAGGAMDGHTMDIPVSTALQLLTPNVSQFLADGSQYQVTWLSNNLLTLQLDFSSNNGSSWTTITAGLAANAEQYVWTVPSVSTSLGRLRILDQSNPLTYVDVSDSTFTILSPIADKYFGGSFDGHSVNNSVLPSITVVQPNGGEILYPGLNYTLTWTSSNVANVVLEYSTNAGSSWNSISTSEPAPLGQYVWTVPSTYSQTALLRITDASNNIVRDTSNLVWRIPVETTGKFAGGGFDGQVVGINNSNALTLISPNGGEVLADGSQIAINWSANNLLNVNLEFSSNNGSSWSSIATNLVASLGTYMWTVPSVNTTLGLIRISDVVDPITYLDASNGVFSIFSPLADKYYGGSYDGHSVKNTIVPSLTLLTPNGNEVLYPSSFYNITWNNTNVTSVALEYSTNQGSSWVLISPSEPAALGAYTWTVPSTASLLAWVRVSDANNSLVADTSNAVFTIAQEAIAKYVGGSGDGHALSFNAANALVLTTPNGGENLADGGLYSITWSANNLVNINLEFTSNNGSTWSSIVTNTPASAGSYLWTIPSVSTSMGRVRITDVVNPLTYIDVSDTTFSIFTPVADKYFGGGFDGNAFNINQVPAVTLVQPNGGEVVYPGTVTNITWTSTNVSTVSLEYSTNQGSSWVSISTSEPAPLGVYAWTVPNTPTQLAWVRITDNTTGVIRDTSNAVFAIGQEAQSKYAGGSFDGHGFGINLSTALTVVNPNIRESLGDGAIYSINWLSNNLLSVNIEFSSNNGSSWNSVVTGSPANLETYLWTVPSVNTSLGRIRISDVTNPILYNDVSDSAFSIFTPIADKYYGGSYDGHSQNVNTPNSLTVLTPNGGERLYPGIQTTITWSSTNVVNVSLEYSTNQGSSWVLISGSEPAILGQYAWTVP